MRRAHTNPTNNRALARGHFRALVHTVAGFNFPTVAEESMGAALAFEGIEFKRPGGTLIMRILL